MTITDILTLGQLNERLAITCVTGVQLAALGFQPLDNKAVCAQLPQDQAKQLRAAKLYRADDLPRIRKQIAARLLAANQLPDPTANA